MQDVPLASAREPLADRLPRALLAAAAVLAVGLSLVRVAVFWTNEAYLDTVSGVWTALASDLSQGLFYRPLFGPDGFGGTRYFPLHIVLHGGLIRLVGHPVLSGQLMAALSVLGLGLGVHAVTRAAGASRLLAASSGALVLASQTTQEALLSIKGDALPAALNLLGVALIASHGAAARPVLGAAALFTLAFAAKPTAVYGVLAATVWLLASRQPARALRLAASTAAGGATVLALLYVASGGRAFETLWAGASTGLRLVDFVKAPLTFAQLARQVPETLVFIEIGLAAALAIAARTRSVASLPLLVLGAALVTSVPIFALEGTDTNHLIDANAAAIVALAGWVVMEGESRAHLGVAALAVAALAASLSLGSGVVNRSSEQRHGTLAEVLALVPDQSRPILAENPLVPLAAGQRPYLLDSYMFRILDAADPSFGTPLREALARQEFAAVVLERHPHDDRGREWYRAAFFGDGFIDALERRYELVGEVGMRVVYRPRP